MTSHEDRIAKRRAEIEAQLAEFDREDAERQAAAANAPAAAKKGGFVGALRSAAFLVSILLLATALSGTAITLIRLAGDDFDDAEREGLATVTSCDRRGPITNKGFGYWESCTATINWDGGGIDRVTVGEVFTSADIDTVIRVGDLGYHRTSKLLVREDAQYRPWLIWIGFAVGALALPPGFIGLVIVRELLRFRR